MNDKPSDIFHYFDYMWNDCDIYFFSMISSYSLYLKSKEDYFFYAVVEDRSSSYILIFENLGCNLYKWSKVCYLKKKGQSF